MATQSFKSSLFFSSNSPLQAGWPNFAVRDEQRVLAEQVEAALLQRSSVALEAPTGTGKTLAYLIPALLHSTRVIISVGNRTLQDHLWLGEYQKLRARVPGMRKLTVLKGCENYLCRARLDDALQVGDAWVSERWQAISAGLLQTENGELNTLPLPAQDLPQLRQTLTLTADQCSGQRCAHFEACFFQRARQKAIQADVLLINHTLLLTDNRLFEKGMGALLPLAESIIVDEAHQLPDMLVRFNTETIDGYRLQRWIKQLRHQIGNQLTLFPALQTALQQLEQLWRQIERQLQASNVENLVAINANSLTPLLKLLFTLDTHLRHLPISRLQLEPLQLSLNQWRQMLSHSMAAEQTIHGDLSGKWLRLVAGRVHSPFSSLNSGHGNWIFLSATLAVEGSFDYFKRVLDFPDLQVQIFQGHLDYARKALLWVPSELPEPAAENFMVQWVGQVLQVAERLHGGILMLFSSFDALQNAAACLPANLTRTVLIQQPGVDRQQLLESFRRDANSILLATGSFWEGIDVAGDALRCIAIDKLPFTPPDDVLALAWKHLASQQGKQVFQDYMVPQAVTRLRQGVGRLLRASNDCGLVMVGDVRLLRKAYGYRFMASLPPMPLARDLGAVETFLQQQGIGNVGADISMTPSNCDNAPAGGTP